ncbi:MAG: magnesium chelatase subunit D [Erythrobacter sp.]|nr:magnesium chelatase subunit D [Erythrobacter sp.]NCQ64852.1 magnesium chelatase subunit D [Alphaproteobacteria bacterium]
MSGEAPPHSDAAQDAVLALSLLLTAPHLFGGISLKGAGPVRDALVADLRAALDDQFPVRRLPAHIDDERLLGGVDLAASLARGEPVRAKGLLDEVGGGLLIVPLAERLGEAIAGRLAQSLDGGGPSFGLIMLDDGMVEDDEAPPASLIERVAFRCDLTRAAMPGAKPVAAAQGLSRVAPLDEEALHALAATALALGIGSVRALNFAGHAARAHAALEGRRAVQASDIAAAARLVLAPRATRMPEMAEDDRVDTPPPPENGDAGEREDAADPGDGALHEVVLEAALAALPPDLLARLADGQTRRGSTGGGGGKRMQSGQRGKPLGARPGMPRGGARLALVDTLRAAVPWQAVRRGEGGANDDTLIFRKTDLRVRRYEERGARVTIFCVDASGSAAAARLAEAKGAVELMLAQAYVTRSEVALVAFRGDGAELLLPPTRSLTRARRTLAALPGGGGTPIAHGLKAGRELAEAVAARGKTPHLVILTDGRANVGADGKGGRAQAREDALAAARAIAMRGFDALVVDISARTAPEASDLARAMHARFLALPMADASRLHAAVSAAQPGARAA